MANGNNMSMGPNDIDFTGCTSLTCVTVDNVSLSNQVWPPFFESGVTFSTNCSGGGAPLATNIDVSGFQGATTVAVGSDLQMEVIITPSAAAGQNVLWQVQNGTGQATVDLNNGVLTGVAAGTVTVGATATDGSGVYGLTQITVTEALSLEASSSEMISLYPNPVTDQFFVTSTSKIEMITVYSLDGAMVFNTNESVVDVSMLSQGVYLVEIETASQKITQKLIKQ